MERMKELERKIGYMETEITLIKRTMGVRAEKKSFSAWNELEKLGKEISKGWGMKKPSWKIISESRR